MNEQIDTHEVYKQIKKHNGEHFARILRNEGLLDIPNITSIIEYAGKTEQDASDLVGYLRYIQQQTKISKDLSKSEYTDPIKLLDLAGYNAFYVNNLEQQNSIKKYFKHYEELCTFRDPTRYQNYYIIHAVKKDVDEIKREYFTHPDRQDRYGTSVISIQIAKNGSHISIKNRYNHTVNNPDATFDNNPDNIIPGLSYSLQKHFDINFTFSPVPVPSHFILRNNQLIRYNTEINNVYIGDGYYVDNNGIQHIHKDYEIQMDHFILDTRTNKIRDITDTNETTEASEILYKEITNKKITLKRNGKETIIFADNEEFAHIENGNITALTLNNCTYLPDHFLKHNKRLKTFIAPKLKQIGSFCFLYNKELTELNLPELESIGNYFLESNEKLQTFTAPKLRQIGSYAFYENIALIELNLPELENMNYGFLASNEKLHSLKAPKLKHIAHACLGNNEALTELNLLELEKMGDSFLGSNEKLHSFKAPKLKHIGGLCFNINNSLIELNLPELETIDGIFLNNNKKLQTFIAPKLKQIGNCVFEHNKALTELNLPELETVGEGFLRVNKKLHTFTAPKLRQIGYRVFEYNKKLSLENLPEIMQNTPDLLPLRLQRKLQLENGIKQIKEKAKDFTNRIIKIFTNDVSTSL